MSVDDLLSIDNAPITIHDIPDEDAEWLEGVCLNCRRVYRFAPPEQCLWCDGKVELPSKPSLDNVNQDVQIRRGDDGKWEGRERYATLSEDNPNDIRHGKGFWRGCKCDVCNAYRRAQHRKQAQRRKNRLIEQSITVGE